MPIVVRKYGVLVSVCGGCGVGLLVRYGFVGCPTGAP